MNCGSKEEQIYAQASAKGISHDVIYDTLDTAMDDQVTSRVPGKSAGWRLENAEQGVWANFFPGEPFPDQKPIVQKELTADATTPTKSIAQMKSAIAMEQRGDSIRAKVEPLSSSPMRTLGVAQSLTESQTLAPLSSPYVSYAQIITSKAAKLGVQMNDFQAVFSEKKKIAETRFPEESTDWQTWFAESMTWAFYFKEEPFPAVEPPRLYPLRSNTDECSHKTVTSRGSGEKWLKFGEAGFSPQRVVTVDSYRPSDSAPLRTTTDRAIPLPPLGPIDSYRPGLSLNRPASSSNPASLNRSASMSNSVPSNRPFGVNPTVNSSATSNRSSNLSNSNRAVYYTSLEKVMEKKAIALGIRREFFQYLQKKRDEVRIEHPDCSPQYRHYAADTRIWARFFNKDPFPAAEPRGPDLHSRRCPMSRPFNSTDRLPPVATQDPRIVTQQRVSQSLNNSEQLNMTDVNAASASPVTRSHNSSKRLQSQESTKSGRMSIRGVSKIIVPEVIIPFNASGISRLYREITKNKNYNELKEALQEHEFFLHFNWRSKEVDPDCVDTLVIYITPKICDDVDAVERGFLILLSWAMKVSWDQEFSLLTHLKKCFTTNVPPQMSNRSRRVNDSNAEILRILLGTQHNRLESFNDSNAPENDWQKYANMFQVTGDLERLIIEEAAKAEGDLRMVYDETSGQVIGLREFAKRVASRANENRSLEVNNFEEFVADRAKPNYSEYLSGRDQNRSVGLNDPIAGIGMKIGDPAKESRLGDLNDCELNHSLKVKDSADRIEKRKLEDDKQDWVQIEKKVRL